MTAFELHSSPNPWIHGQRRVQHGATLRTQLFARRGGFLIECLPALSRDSDPHVRLIQFLATAVKASPVDDLLRSQVDDVPLTLVVRPVTHHLTRAVGESFP